MCKTGSKSSCNLSSCRIKYVRRVCPNNGRVASKSGGHGSLTRGRVFDDAAADLNLSLRDHGLLMVPMEGVEPTHSHEYQILSLARLPIPPHRLSGAGEYRSARAGVKQKNI